MILPHSWHLKPKNLPNKPWKHQADTLQKTRSNRFTHSRGPGDRKPDYQDRQTGVGQSGKYFWHIRVAIKTLRISQINPGSIRLTHSSTENWHHHFDTHQGPGEPKCQWYEDILELRNNILKGCTKNSFMFSRFPRLLLLNVWEKHLTKEDDETLKT
jgi:hypothetical protein